MSEQIKPILYSFRRCPYAMRARMAIYLSGVQVELREVALKNKPAELLACSSKGTVPVLVLPDKNPQQVIEESLDIMLWAFAINDPAECLSVLSEDQFKAQQTLLQRNDEEFKFWLDRYKYFDRFPEHSQLYYREKAEIFLSDINTLLGRQAGLLRDSRSFADIAIFPFVRQFAYVDKAWFDQAPYPQLQRWLTKFLDSLEFSIIMNKYPAYSNAQPGLSFPEDA